MSDKKRTHTRTMKVWTVMDAEGNERLVRAYTSADVLRHVRPQFVITPASLDDIISLMAAGVMIETVGLPEAVPAEAAAERAKQGDIVDDTFEPQPEKAPPPPAIAIVAAPPTPPAPPAPRQEDAFSAPLG